MQVHACKACNFICLIVRKNKSWSLWALRYFLLHSHLVYYIISDPSSKTACLTYSRASRGRCWARFALVNFAQDSVLLISGSRRGEQECIVAFLKMVWTKYQVRSWFSFLSACEVCVPDSNQQVWHVAGANVDVLENSRVQWIVSRRFDVQAERLSLLARVDILYAVQIGGICRSFAFWIGVFRISWDNPGNESRLSRDSLLCKGENVEQCTSGLGQTHYDAYVSSFFHSLCWNHTHFPCLYESSTLINLRHETYRVFWNLVFVSPTFFSDITINLGFSSRIAQASTETSI